MSECDDRKHEENEEQERSTVEPIGSSVHPNQGVSLVSVSDCGVSVHPSECLCDVVITLPCVVAPITNARDLWLGREITDYLDLCSPMDDAAILAFFEMQVDTHDAVEGSSHIEIPAQVRKQQKVTPVMNEFIAGRVVAGDPSPIIRAKVERLYGVKMSPSHMSHMRRRLVSVNL